MPTDQTNNAQNKTGNQIEQSTVKESFGLPSIALFALKHQSPNSPLPSSRERPNQPNSSKKVPLRKRDTTRFLFNGLLKNNSSFFSTPSSESRTTRLLNEPMELTPCGTLESEPVISSPNPKENLLSQFDGTNPNNPPNKGLLLNQEPLVGPPLSPSTTPVTYPATSSILYDRNPLPATSTSSAPKVPAQHDQQTSSNKGGADIQKPELTSDGLRHIVQTIQSQIKKGTNRWTTRNSTSKNDQFESALKGITSTMNANELSLKIDELRKICAIRRNFLHFWAEPHSVGEFEQLLSAYQLPKSNSSGCDL